uniref:Coenzyme Q-binding protein COQ10 START domain-containing protein n=1 Tax=Helicotheca tamesis TaxID=374047 RepID=A0A7S2HGW9_9STRA|mmetsp:Transcript_17954/g.24717  ORF Transcript_17954/g.24717 Transcript_17954/m.24717 type:complete len:641 (+) Transcript_17954:123-2045(+)|eukprot:CAMPEP_0185725938 /NCGR_PEP_ID=MMETSP1171-20130828/2058_1 /TAXON_ID=374046 /ORGANISM="Helicotheca tamensis, Strain CCMP826" /LENGTH=640 /DNA_ID=CAMNT_0028394185 /DNA_START=60 /DNA_END=1982 /DNA_ORIENTATION=-
MKRQRPSIFKNAQLRLCVAAILTTLLLAASNATPIIPPHQSAAFALSLGSRHNHHVQRWQGNSKSLLRTDGSSGCNIRVSLASTPFVHTRCMAQHTVPIETNTNRMNLRQLTKMHMANDGSDDSESTESLADNNNESQAQPPQNQTTTTTTTNTTTKMRNRDKVKAFAKNIAKSAINVVHPKPVAIAAVLSDSAINTAEIAADKVFKPENIQYMKDSVKTKIRRSRALVDSISSSSSSATSQPPPSAIEQAAEMEAEALSAIDAISLARTTAADAFFAAETAIVEAERALGDARVALASARAEAAEAIANAEANAAQAAATARRAEELAASAAMASSSVVVAVESDVATNVDVAAAGDAQAAEEEVLNAYSLSYEEVDYHLAEMAPPFIGEDQCLVPGEAVVRVEKAPENSRRIFAGIDIMSSVDDVWKLLTDYEHLQDVVPNLVVNDVLELYNGSDDIAEIDSTIPEEKQCELVSKYMKGSKLRQVGGAKVVGINFSARTTLEVREWPNGMPDVAHYQDEIYEGQSRNARAKKEKGQKLTRYRFPRPFALSTLPTKDISMQSIENDDGEFRMYQGVWRMQPLPGCAPEGQYAMRLTYAVEISPRAYLPVALIENRIAQDLCANLRAIRDYVSPPVLETA